MTKDELLAKVSEGKYTHEQLIAWVKSLPSSLNVIKPNILKKGDVLHHSIFHHPIVILKVKEETYICCMLTSNDSSDNIKCKSRFFHNSYISKFLLEISKRSLDTFRYMGMYDNNKHLTEIHKQLLESFK